jgi:hypothetical protein
MAHGGRLTQPAICSIEASIQVRLSEELPLPSTHVAPVGAHDACDVWL